MDTSKTKLGSSFGWLNATQFLGAFNDNIFKLLIILFLIGPPGEANTSNVTALAGAVFVVALGIRKEGSRRDIYSLAKKLIRLRLLQPPEK